MMRTMMMCVLLLQGCAYKQALSRGDELAKAGDWAGAYAAYDEALTEKDDSEEALAGRQRARDALVEADLELATAKLESKDYEAASEALTRVAELDGDRPETFELRQDLATKLEADFRAAWEGDDYRNAYELVVLGARLTPDAGYLEDGFRATREYFVKASEYLLKRDQHEEALATIRTITELEPERQGDIATLEQRILTDWADTTVSEAVAQARAKREGASAVLFARAYEIAGRRDDLDRARKIAANLAPEGRFSVRLKVTGDSRRVKAVREALEAALDTVPDADLLNTPSADMTLYVAVGTARCTEVKQATPQEKEYVSGQVEKPNPVYVDLTAKRAAEEKKEAVAAKQVAELEPQLKKAEESLASFDLQLENLEKEKARVQSSLDMAAGQRDSAKARVAELDADIKLAGSTGSTSATISDMEDEKKRVQTTLKEWQEQVDTHQASVDAAQRKVDALQVERGPAAEAAKRLKTGYDAVVADRDAARKAFGELSSQRANTAETVWEDVLATFAYDEEKWTRTCKAPISVVAGPRWSTSLDTKAAYAPENTTEDTAHKGHEKAEVPVDDKAYPVDDAELWAQGDAASVEQITAWMKTLADDHFAVRSKDTVAKLEASPLRGTTDLVSLYVGAPGRIDEPTREAFAAHLKARFQVEKMQLLESAAAE